MPSVTFKDFQPSEDSGDGPRGQRPSVEFGNDRRLETVLALLGEVTPTGDNFQARCPAHDDSVESLSVGEGDDGKVLLYCHAGCPVSAIAEAIGISTADLFPPLPEPRWHVYTDEDGNPIHANVKMYGADGKSYWIRKHVVEGEWRAGLGGCRRVPYRLAEVIGAHTVYVVEGEKDVESLEAWGLIATSSKDWKPEWAKYLAAAQTVVVIPDNDEPGKRIAGKVIATLQGKNVKFLELPNLPEKGDVSDWIAAGGTVEELTRMVYEEAVAVSTEDDNAVLSDADLDDMEAGEAAAESEIRMYEMADENKTWRAVAPNAMRTAFNGVDRLTPTMLHRSDAEAILYPRRINLFMGEPEACKTWAAHIAIVQELHKGNVAILMDFEDSADVAAERLKQLGLSEEQVANQLIYINPTGPFHPQADPTSMARVEVDLKRRLTELGNAKLTLAVIDSMTEAMAADNWDSYLSTDVTKMYRTLGDFLTGLGAGVVFIDHVAKSKDSQGRWALGSERKISGLNGVAYRFKASKPFGRGKVGKIKISVSKDRGGYVRRLADGDQIATLHLLSDPITENVTYSLEAPDHSLEGQVEEHNDEAEMLDTLVYRFIVENDGCTATQLKAGVEGAAQAVTEARDRLAAEGRIRTELAPRGSIKHRSSSRSSAGDGEGEANMSLKIDALRQRSR